MLGIAGKYFHIPNRTRQVHQRRADHLYAGAAQLDALAILVDAEAVASVRRREPGPLTIRLDATHWTPVAVVPIFLRQVGFLLRYVRADLPLLTRALRDVAGGDPLPRAARRQLGSRDVRHPPFDAWLGRSFGASPRIRRRPLLGEGERAERRAGDAIDAVLIKFLEVRATGHPRVRGAPPSDIRDRRGVRRD